MTCYHDGFLLVNQKGELLVSLSGSLTSYLFKPVTEQIYLRCEINLIAHMSSSQEKCAVEATARMTLDEMFVKYPKRYVEQAVVHRNYKEYGPSSPL